jgi:hypothetical protein
VRGRAAQRGQVHPLREIFRRGSLGRHQFTLASM